jgi:hypothetical protein
MPTTLQNAKDIVSDYRNFPRSLRSSQEDIIIRLRGKKIRGRLISNMSEEQVYSISNRLYQEVNQIIEKSQIKKSDLEKKVEGPTQLSLFDNSPTPYQE